MPVKKGDRVKVEYEGRFEDGEVFDSSKHGDHSHPLEFEVGSGQVIKGFDQGVMGMKKGEEKEVTIKPEDAYGEYRPDLVQKMPRSMVPEGQEVKKGMVLAVELPNGAHAPVTVKDVDDKEVTLDLNHPMAGKMLIFKIKVVEIEPKK
ncbi:MAG: peptidylprolyl isomerase [Candidatus Aenigmarchaeota archaeon]|nr:peptidylprolyl isomerase [Candidatus Aenigmarchaeota archaeon]